MFYVQFWTQRNILADILNKEILGILFILTQDAYLYNPIYSYALFISVFVCISLAMKNFISTFSYVLRCK